ncbi:MAG: hypothetical protein KIS92_25465, partial [Planctomycetota bacterium]|nr:hypothetical protein [Planctomycetota bacterium]
MRILACLTLIVAAASVSPARAESNFVELAYQRATMDQKPEEWAKFVKQTRDRFETWSNDNPSGAGNINRYLNEKLLPIAMSVPGGEVKNLKKFIYWIALYKTFESLP